MRRHVIIPAAFTTFMLAATVGSARDVTLNNGDKAPQVVPTRKDGSVPGGGSSTDPLYDNPAGASFATNQSPAGTAVTQLCAARTGRRNVTVENLGTTPVYIGSSGVTATSGALLPGVVGASISLNTQAAVFGLTASGTQQVACFEVY